MSDWQALILALLQGLTEFLPISSSAHLILPAQLFGWPDQGLAFDVAVHVGTLVAVISYFRHDLQQMLTAGTTALRGGEVRPEARLLGAILLATLPALVLGGVASELIASALRSTWVIAVTTLLFGVLMGIADRYGRKQQPLSALTWRQALWIGLAQALALIPGTSRSGITLTMALALGLQSQAAARFSFLLSIPVILLAGGYQALGVWNQAEPLAWRPLMIGVLVSFCSALLVIHLFLRALARIGLWPFVLYRLALGIFLCLWLACSAG